jgi:hypothetical protein
MVRRGRSGCDVASMHGARLARTLRFAAPSGRVSVTRAGANCPSLGPGRSSPRTSLRDSSPCGLRGGRHVVERLIGFAQILFRLAKSHEHGGALGPIDAFEDTPHTLEPRRQPSVFASARCCLFWAISASSPSAVPPSNVATRTHTRITSIRRGTTL